MAAASHTPRIGDLHPVLQMPYGLSVASYGGGDALALSRPLLRRRISCPEALLAHALGSLEQCATDLRRMDPDLSVVPSRCLTGDLRRAEWDCEFLVSSLPYGAEADCKDSMRCNVFTHGWALNSVTPDMSGCGKWPLVALGWQASLPAISRLSGGEPTDASWIPSPEECSSEWGFGAARPCDTHCHTVDGDEAWHLGGDTGRFRASLVRAQAGCIATVDLEGGTPRGLLTMLVTVPFDLEERAERAIAEGGKDGLATEFPELSGFVGLG
jgi:hypothetical protein